MISNQICLKPYVASLAAAKNVSVPAFYATAARELSTPQADQVVASEKFQAPLTLTQSLRLKESDLKEVTSELTGRGVSAAMADATARGMVLGAIATQPGMFAGLGQVLAILSLDEKPLSQSAVNSANEFSIQPGLNHIAEQMETNVEGLLSKLATGYAQPGATRDPKIQGNIQAASIFRPVSSEVAELEAKFQAQGLSAEASGAIVSGLVLSAAAYEPKFREGLGQSLRIGMFEQENKANNFFEKV